MCSELLLDVDHPRLAEVVAGEDPLELAEVDPEIGADDAHLVGAEVGAGEVHRLAGAVEEQGAQRVIVVGQEVR